MSVTFNHVSAHFVPSLSASIDLYTCSVTMWLAMKVPCSLSNVN